MPYASINGYRMFYDVQGEGEEVVFIHGGFPSYETQLQAIDAYLDRDLTEVCARIAVPTRVVHGSNDREVPVEWGRDLAAKIHESEFCMYPDESHGLVHRCSAVRKDLIAFFNQNGTTL